MEVYHDIEGYPASAERVVATIGNFDGVHLGHLRILQSVIADARERGLRSLLLTFDPHPLSVVAPAHRPRLVMTQRQKLGRLEDIGLDGVLIAHFDQRLAALSGEGFFGTLDERVGLAAVHVGENFRFGQGRRGDFGLLREIGRRRGFDVIGIGPVCVDGEVVSSTAVRDALDRGEVELAGRLLGRPYELVGEVTHGDGRGRRLGFPTANLEVENEMVPRRGVYVTDVGFLASRHGSVTNIGVRPTFGGSRQVVETHLLDYHGDLYRERLTLRFLARLRDERRFAGPEELADQIARDRAAAEAYFRNLDIRVS